MIRQLIVFAEVVFYQIYFDCWADWGPKGQSRAAWRNTHGSAGYVRRGFLENTLCR